MEGVVLWVEDMFVVDGLERTRVGNPAVSLTTSSTRPLRRHSSALMYLGRSNMSARNAFVGAPRALMAC